MVKEKPVKAYIGTILTALIVLILIVLCLRHSDKSFTANQRETLKILLIVCGASILYCFSVGEAVQNFSQMDKLWSLLPIAYAWIVAGRGVMKPRLVLFALIVTAWGIRLTVNFARKGAYRLKFWEGEEDYRWAVVRGTRFFKTRLAWTAFDLFFISTYQNLLVLAICLPALGCMESVSPLGVWDVLASLLSLSFLALETVADEYQWQFHETKKKQLSQNAALADLPAPYSLGFNTTGVWAFMRHPNYLGEQAFWLSLYLFSAGAGITRLGILHWTMIGPLLLILLFMGSSTLGESISSKKYPLYRDYMNCVCKYLPLRRYACLRGGDAPADDKTKTEKTV